MERALALASLGLRKTSPNPMVGCVIVKDGRIIGEGWHKQYGGPHAEINALTDAKSRGFDVKGSTVYVTLEPCAHYGKTPPCAYRLVREKVAEVVLAARDPNPQVDGRGIEILRDDGVKVTELKDFERRANFLNRGFIHVQKLGMPFVTLKAAVSLDGKMCLGNGSSKWITGQLARTEAHRLRAENDAVLVGVGTVLADDPELTVRNVVGENPLRVILDAKLSTPPEAKVIGTDGKCLIFAGLHSDKDRQSKLEEAGAEVIRLPYFAAGRVELTLMLKTLAERGILTLLVEGGPAVISAFLRERLASYINIFTAPRILGEGKGFNLKMNFADVSRAYRLADVKTKRLGNDTLTEGFLECSQD